MCVLGKRLLKDVDLVNCTKAENGQLYNTFCKNKLCDPYFITNNVTKVRGIKGIASGVFFGQCALQARLLVSTPVRPAPYLKLLLVADNIADSFLMDGQYIAKGKDPKDIERLDSPSFNQVYADITTAFTILIGIFFPSVTGEPRRPQHARFPLRAPET